MAGILPRTSSGAPARTMKPSQELLDDLCSRFLLNAPDEDLQSFERILFLIEQAHWFYEDNTRVQFPHLKSLGPREFASLMFQSCAALRPYSGNIDNIYKDFTSYKVRVPVTGAIILDGTYEKCLVVKGWKAGASWSFPRGKKNKDEEDHKCAIREVLEETGFDVSGLLKVEDNLEMVIGEQRIRLFIVGGVDEDTKFAPQTKNEISDIAWHRVDELPTGGNEMSHSRGTTGIKYYMVSPFVGPLRAWIAAHKPSSIAKSEANLKGANVQKIKTSTNQGLPTPVGILTSPLESASTFSLPVSEPRGPEPVEAPGKSFRNFKFDYALILQKLDEV